MLTKFFNIKTQSVQRRNQFTDDGMVARTQRHRFRKQTLLSRPIMMLQHFKEMFKENAFVRSLLIDNNHSRTNLGDHIASVQLKQSLISVLINLKSLFLVLNKCLSCFLEVKIFFVSFAAFRF